MLRLLLLGLGLSSSSALLCGADNSATKEMRLTTGTSTVIDYAGDVSRISTSNPEIVDAVAVSAREVMLHGKAPGVATVVIWSNGAARSVYRAVVEPDLEPVRALLRQTFPAESIQVQATRDALSLTGTVSSQSVAERAVALASGAAKTVVNALQIAPERPQRQIVLHVKFAELNRSVSTAIGVNLVSTGAANTPGLITTGQFSAPKPGKLEGTIPGHAAGTTTQLTVSDALNIFAFRPDLNLGAFIRDLQTKGMLQILAEPNLVTTDGKEASFLVGGEFPIPVVQTGVSTGAVTVQFREFGIRLTFLPALTASNTIKLYVKPEVSTIDLANAVVLSGFTIPALATRRMETRIELGLGQSFVIGGLIDDRVSQSLSSMPGLAHIPLLGALFKSRQQNKSKTELLVIVTPEIAAPVSAGAVPQIAMPEEFLKPITLAPSRPGTTKGARRQ